MLIQEQVPLAPLTTLGVGGPARYFVEAANENEILTALEIAKSKELPVFVLGGGSNLVVSDAGFNGLVLKVGLRGIRKNPGSADRVLYEVGAGEDWDAFVAGTVAANCAGIECLSGIPGTVGGTPVQNVGAYGQEVASSIRQLKVIDAQALTATVLSNQECGFAYRTSRFNTVDRGRFIILSVSFELLKGGTPTLYYADVQQYFALPGTRPSLAEVRAAVREIRRRKAMLIVPGDENARSAGSFFRNPVVHSAKRNEIIHGLAKGESLPYYPASDDMVKLPAAWLVEHAGFHRGYTRGHVGVSRLHALAIVNRGGATAADVLALQHEIQEGVLRKFGIELRPEPVFVGFDQSGRPQET